MDFNRRLATSLESRLLGSDDQKRVVQTYGFDWSDSTTMSST